jgi:hypothetical protein
MKRFVPPTIEECKAYVVEKGYECVDGESFFMFYASKGWMVGRSKMVCWHSSMGGWDARERKKRGISPTKCLVCRKPGHKHQLNKKNQKVWLCEKCLECMRVIGFSVWGWLSKAQIERKVEQGKCKLKPESLYEVKMKTVPKEPNRRAVINRQKDALGVR